MAHLPGSVRQSDTRIVSPNVLAALPAWLANRVVGSQRFLSPKTPRIAEFWCEEMRQAAGAPDARVFLSGDERDPQGIALYCPLTWETGFFGCRSVAIRFLVLSEAAVESTAGSLISSIVEHSRREKVSFLSTRVYADQVPFVYALQSTGFYITDCALDYVIKLDGPIAPQTQDGYVIRSARAEDLQGTVKLAERAFEHHFGRFHSDPKISRAEAARFYPRWIEDSFRGYADTIIVAEHSKSIVGATLWKRASALEAEHRLPVGHYSLGTVAPEHSRRGLFKRLTLEGLRTFEGTTARFVEGPTHVLNVPVQRAYVRMGFRVADARYAFHLWLDR